MMEKVPSHTQRIFLYLFVSMAASLTHNRSYERFIVVRTSSDLSFDPFFTSLRAHQIIQESLFVIFVFVIFFYFHFQDDRFEILLSSSFYMRIH